MEHTHAHAHLQLFDELNEHTRALYIVLSNKKKNMGTHFAA